MDTTYLFWICNYDDNIEDFEEFNYLTLMVSEEAFYRSKGGFEDRHISRDIPAEVREILGFEIKENTFAYYGFGDLPLHLRITACVEQLESLGFKYDGPDDPSQPLPWETT